MSDITLLSCVLQICIKSVTSWLHTSVSQMFACLLCWGDLRVSGERERETLLWASGLEKQGMLYDGSVVMVLTYSVGYK